MTIGDQGAAARSQCALHIDMSRKCRTSTINGYSFAVAPWWHLTLHTDYELWMVDVFPGVLCACDGVPRSKA